MRDRDDTIVIVGAGLSGLAAALALAQAGRHVRVVDRCRRPGGRCGAFELDGYPFTIACNDFGARIERDLASVGVRDVRFVPSTNVIDLCDRAPYVLPPSPRTALRLLRHAPSIVGMVRRIQKGGRKPLGELFPSERDRDGLGFRLVALLAYALGTPPLALRADLLRADFSKQHDYGHDKMVVPVGGPQAITDAMVARLHALGGELQLATDVTDVRRNGRGFVVETSNGPTHARTVIRMLDGGRGRAGLEVAQLLFVLPRAFAFVAARTLIVSPPRPEAWIAELDDGRWPATWGFHVFADRELHDARTLTGYVLAPRGVRRFDDATRAGVLATIERGIERHLPGFAGALRYRRLLDPAEFEALHGVSPSLSHEIPTANSDASPIASDEPGLLHIGNGVEPPGEHANAAIVSGLSAAARVLAAD
ncbi:MAG TPA: FAD-dependent oxidoreductase [Nannocystaceae bacterium]|nr:FAD-dependent oxidoreductase [Nannocystaceae bacterium]